MAFMDAPGSPAALQAGAFTNDSIIFETMSLRCDRGASPSDRGQWGSAFSATAPSSPWVKIPRAGPETDCCAPMPAISGSHPSVARGYLIVDSLII